MATGPWGRLWRAWAAAPEFYRERQGQPLELAQAMAEPALSAVLVTTLIGGAAAFVTALFPLDQLWGLPVFVLANALLGFFYGRRLQWPGILWREWLVLLAPSLVLWRGVTALTSRSPLDATLGRWLHDPAQLIDGSFIIGGGLLIVAWTQGLGYGRDLAALHPGPFVPPQRPEPGSRAYWEEDERRHGLYLPPPTALAARWLGGGVTLAVLGGLATGGVRQFADGRAIMRLLTFGASDETAALPNVLAYMVAGLVLVGLAQSSRLRANWAADGVTASAGLARRTLSALGALVVLALCIGLVLPTRYSLGLGDALGAALGFVTYAMAWVASLAIALIAVLLTVLDGLLGTHTHGGGRLAPTPPPPPAGHGSAHDALGSLVFWLVALLVLAYCGGALWRQAEGRVPALTRVRVMATRVVALLAALAHALIAGMRRGATEVATLVRRWGHGTGIPAHARIPRPSLRRLGPRELVAYLYLSIEERARRAGLPRQTGQTATEYSRHLRSRMPDLDPDLGGLTDLFLEARYSPHPFEDEHATAARSLWQRVRARLRSRR